MKSTRFFVAVTSLTVLVFGLVACGSKTKVVETKTVPVSKPEPKIDLDVVRGALNSAQHESGFMAAAKAGDELDGVCAAYHRSMMIDEVQTTYSSKLDIHDPKANEVFGEISHASIVATQEFIKLAYQKMANGQALPDCTGDGEAAFIVKVGETIDSSIDVGDKNFNPKVVRASYLKAVKPKVQAEIAEYKKSGAASKDLGESGLSGYIEDVQSNFNLSFAELGIPADVAKEISGRL